MSSATATTATEKPGPLLKVRRVVHKTKGKPHTFYLDPTSGQWKPVDSFDQCRNLAAKLGLRGITITPV
jgi:hypothetical protein